MTLPSTPEPFLAPLPGQEAASSRCRRRSRRRAPDSSASSAAAGSDRRPAAGSCGDSADGRDPESARIRAVVLRSTAPAAMRRRRSYPSTAVPSTGRAPARRERAARARSLAQAGQAASARQAAESKQRTRPNRRTRKAQQEQQAEAAARSRPSATPTAAKVAAGRGEASGTRGRARGRQESPPRQAKRRAEIERTHQKALDEARRAKGAGRGYRVPGPTREAELGCRMRIALVTVSPTTEMSLRSRRLSPASAPWRCCPATTLAIGVGMFMNARSQAQNARGRRRACRRRRARCSTARRIARPTGAGGDERHQRGARQVMRQPGVGPLRRTSLHSRPITAASPTAWPCRCTARPLRGNPVPALMGTFFGVVQRRHRGHGDRRGLGGQRDDLRAVHDSATGGPEQRAPPMPRSTSTPTQGVLMPDADSLRRAEATPDPSTDYTGFTTAIRRRRRS